MKVSPVAKRTLLALIAFAPMRQWNSLRPARRPARLVGEIGYAFIFTMAADSFYASGDGLERRAWKLLHSTGAVGLVIVVFCCPMFHALYSTYTIGLASSQHGGKRKIGRSIRI